MSTVMQLGDIAVHVTLKNIRNVHLGVYPPAGRVRMAAPARMRLDAIRALAISKLPWIRRQQKSFHDQEREAPRDYVKGESHYLWGRRYLLAVEERDAPPEIQVRHGRLVFRVRPGTDASRRADLMAEWYRRELKVAAGRLLQRWQPIVGVVPNQFFVQKMRTKWGSCNALARNIRLNTELAKKPRECLEYIVVHELIHLHEPTHNARFARLMESLMPMWRERRRALNRLPLSHERWLY
jgi:predicted metal-dependent hydrolase